MSKLILPPGSPIHRCFAGLVVEADRVFLAGLPGVGKSLLLQQLSLMAMDAGRPVHLLQWDAARQPFETPDYPLVGGATHPLVIKAVGVWLRAALVEWDAIHRDRGAMLIGEAPLIGGRLMEIARPDDDEAEALLSNKRAKFVLPLPSRALRAIIESRRESSIANPRHEQEVHDAPPDLLRTLWNDLNRVALRLGVTDAAEAEAPYSPEIYEAVYRRLLRHRQVISLPMDEPLQPAGSVYEFASELPQLLASQERAQRILAQVAAATPETLAREQLSRWFEV